MLETAQVSSTVLKFNSNPSPPTATPAATPTIAKTTPTDRKANGAGPADVWDPPDSAGGLTKLGPVKLEVPDSFESIVLHPSSNSVPPPGGTEFAELKPVPFDYGNSTTTTLTGLDSVLVKGNNNNNNNISKRMTELNSSPNSSSSSSSTSSSGGGRPSSTNVNGNFQYSSSSDVTSSASSPPGITKLETLDFTASQDAFDDLASIVGISMGADSTVPNMDGDLDLDAWIENTAQNIRPLVGDDSCNLETILPNGTSQAMSQRLGMSALSQPPYLHMTPVSGSTLQSLLQGNLTPGPPPTGCKVTQLQQRDHHGQPLPPPPYSILQNRLQHGSTGGPPMPVTSNNVVKVDSTFDLMKIADNNNGSNSYLSAAAVAAAAAAVSYADTMPHSTQNPLNHVSTSDGLHRRLGDLGGLAKMKAKQNKMRQKLGMSVSPAGVNSALTGAGGEQGKKMMHHCQICNRGFLNKSNIKVHLRTHTGEKPFKCEHCSKAFRQKAHLLKHMSIHKRISRD